MLFSLVNDQELAVMLIGVVSFALISGFTLHLMLDQFSPGLILGIFLILVGATGGYLALESSVLYKLVDPAMFTVPTYLTISLVFSFCLYTVGVLVKL